MKIFAANEVAAKSRFWYFVPRLNKLKKMTGEILGVNEIFEKKSREVKTYGINLRYISRSGIHNMYKEYRDTTLTSAVQQLYSEMAGRHRARNLSIQIISTMIVPEDKVKSVNLSQYHGQDLKFPLTHIRPRAPRSRFQANRPNTFFG
jgi:large subunit ribosomal protein L18Ae